MMGPFCVLFILYIFAYDMVGSFKFPATLRLLCSCTVRHYCCYVYCLRLHRRQSRRHYAPSSIKIYFDLSIKGVEEVE